MSSDQFETLALTPEEQGMMESGPQDEPEKRIDEPEEKVEEKAPVEAEKKEKAEPEKKDEKTVPLAALHEARKENKEIKSELAKMREQIAFAKQLKEEIAKLKNPESKVPEYTEDPLEHLRLKQEELAKTLKVREEEARKQEEFRKKEDSRSKLIQHITAQEAAFKQTAPDYEGAISYIKDLKTRELQELGVTDPGKIQAALSQTALSFSVQALREGKNPSEALYKMAKLYGYKAQPEPKAEPSAVEKKLDAIEKGLKASKTLSTGGISEVNITPEALLRLAGDDFEKGWRQIFGD